MLLLLLLLLFKLFFSFQKSLLLSLVLSELEELLLLFLNLLISLLEFLEQLLSSFGGRFQLLGFGHKSLDGLINLFVQFLHISFHLLLLLSLFLLNLFLMFLLGFVLLRMNLRLNLFVHLLGLLDKLGGYSCICLGSIRSTSRCHLLTEVVEESLVIRTDTGFSNLLS